MRVLHVIRGLANSSGTTHIVNPLAEAQARAGSEVRVMYVDRVGSAAILPNPELVSAMGFPMTLPFGNPGVSVKFLRAIAPEVARADIVHIHAVWNFPSWISMRCAWRRRKPYVVAPQGSFDPWALRQNMFRKRIYGELTEMPFLRRASCLQALTSKELAQFRAAGLNSRVEIIPNGIPDSTVEVCPCHGQLARNLDLPVGCKTLLYLSRVHPKKGLDILLRAFAEVLYRAERVVLVVAGGDGGSGYRNEMMLLARELGIDASCRFIGEVSGRIKRELLMGADGFALLSHSEGLPVAALEALGAGLPCVLSTECNLPEVAASSAGWVVEPTVEASAAALLSMLGDPIEAGKRSLRAQQLVASRFTWTEIAKQTLGLYESLVRGT